MTTLTSLGWDADRGAELAPYAGTCLPARVARVDGASYVLLTAAGPLRAEVSPALRHAALDRTALPTVGDWVAVGTGGVVVAVLPRRTAFVRHGSAGAHVLAANLDLVVVVAALDRPFAPGLLTLARDSGARPVVALTKADLCPDVRGVVADWARAAGCPVHAVSAVTGAGLAAVRGLLRPGRTALLVGAQGVGKSALATALLGAERMGRQPTTCRELIPLPGGAVLIDTPGLRGLGWTERARGRG